MAPNDKPLPLPTDTVTPMGDPAESVHYTTGNQQADVNEPVEKSSHRRQLNKVRRMLTQARKRGAAQIVTRYTMRGVAVY